MLALTLADFNFIGTANAQIMGGQGGIASFLPFVAILAVMYFFMIRPQSKRAKEHREMVSALKRGDKVTVSNGILGTVSKITNENEMLVEIAPGVEITVVRSSVSQVVSKTPKATDDSKPAVKKTTALKKKAAAKKPATKKAVSKK